MTVNGVDWFQIGAEDPAAAEAFYAGVFGWTFTGDGTGYRLITTPGGAAPSGGLAEAPAHAVFYVTVADTGEACRRIEEAGGKVLTPPTATDGLSFAHVLDPAGNRFAVFTPAPH